ncbi:hypothetical protein Dimus_006101 [Dionaea muscipula]
MGYESIGGAAASSGDDKKKPHAVCVPCPAQGHINPMLKLAKLLHFKGFHVTFVNTEFNHNRLLRTHGSRYLDGLPSFRFEAIPDGIPPADDIDSTQDVPSIFYYTDRECIGPFRELLARLNHDVCTPPVTCIVSDMVMPFTLQAAEEIGVPEVMLWTASALGLLGYAQYPILVQKGLAPLKDWSYLSNGHLDIPVDWVAAMEGITLKQMPSFIRTTNPDDIMFNFVLSMIHRSHKASAIIINTFTELEEAVLSSLSSDFPPLFTIGPLQLILNQIPDLDTSSLGSNLWMEDPTCLGWLDSQDHDSVVYVNFGDDHGHDPCPARGVRMGLGQQRPEVLVDHQAGPCQRGLSRAAEGVRGSYQGSGYAGELVRPGEGVESPCGWRVLDPQRLELDAGEHLLWGAYDLLAVLRRTADQLLVLLREVGDRDGDGWGCEERAG